MSTSARDSLGILAGRVALISILYGFFAGAIAALAYALMMTV